MTPLRRSRTRQDAAPFLAVLGLIVAALMLVQTAPGHRGLSDALLGLLLFFLAAACRADVPDSVSGRAGFAMVRGAALWLILAGLLYAALQEPLTQPHIEPLCWQVSALVPERYWLPAGWGLLSGVAFVFGPGAKGDQRP